MEIKSVIAWAATDETAILSPYSFSLREIGAEDVMIKVLFCGLDHTDIHQMRNEIQPTSYPIVPGHEVVGDVVELGEEAKRKFKVGDLVGVGGFVGSCGNCDCCLSNREQYCKNLVMTYNGIDVDGQHTRGGFASAMVVNHRFVISIPEKINPAQAAPLLCTGVTAYSPLRKYFGFDTNLKGAILGLGGVGHIGVLIAKAMGHNVTVISSSNKKKQEALGHLGANGYLVSSDTMKMNEAAGSFDYILDTIPAVHSIDLYLTLLKPDGKLLIVGVSPKPLQVNADTLILGRKTMTGSLMGSIAETEELLKFWAGKNLSSMIEIVPIDYVNKAVERIENNDIRYRFVLDVAGSGNA